MKFKVLLKYVHMFWDPVEMYHSHAALISLARPSLCVVMAEVCQFLDW